MDKLTIACAVASLFFAGCVLPGESELFVKTSALRKAMHGGQAEIMVSVNGEIALSNANERISAVLEGITTKKDFVLAIADVYSDMFLNPDVGMTKAKDKSEDIRRSISFSVEEREQDVPLLKMEAAFPAALMLKGARFDAEKSSAPIAALEYDPSDGSLGMSTNMLSYVFGFEYMSTIDGANKMLDKLKLIGRDDEPAEMLQVMVGTLPFVMGRERVIFTIEGDDDREICVTGKDVVVDGNPVGDCKTWIHKGDSVCIEVYNKNNKKIIDELEPRVHFFERKKRRWWLLWLF